MKCSRASSARSPGDPGLAMEGDIIIERLLPPRAERQRDTGPEGCFEAQGLKQEEGLDIWLCGGEELAVARCPRSIVSS